MWFKRDCQQDTDACPSTTNQSRPPMKKAIRNERGNMVSDEYYGSILKSASLYVNELVLLVHTKAPAQAPRKTYIEKHFPSQWRSTIGRFEAEHPPLALCASHWKADQLLSEMLRGRKPGIVDTEVKIHASTSSSGSKRKRGNSGTQNVVNNKQRKRKPKRDEHNVSDSDNEGDNDGMESLPNNLPNQEPSISDSFEPVDSAASSISPMPNHKGKAKAKVRPSFDEIAAGALALGRGNTPQTSTVTSALPQDSVHQNGTSVFVRPLPELLILNMINVEATYGSLKDASTQEFSNIPHLPACLELLEKVSRSVAFNGQPCSLTLALLTRIESADPIVPDIDKDDTNLGWGHIQFTAGGITLSTVIRSWENIGNVATAYRLLAAAVKTCRVARHLCFSNNIVATGGFLSDSYLQTLVEIIWDMLKRTTSEQTDPPAVVTSHDSTGASSVSGSLLLAQPLEDRPPNATVQQSTSSAAAPPEISAINKLVQDLHINELKKWILANNIKMPSKQNKQDLIAAVCESKKLPNQDEFEHFVAQRKKPRRKGKVAT